MSSIDVVAANGAPPPESHETPDAASSSLLTRLREQAARQREQRHIEIDIGGWFSPPLVARYGVLPVHELERMNQGIDAQHPDILGYGLEVMARSNSAILAHDGDRLVELSDERGPVTFSHRLALLLDLPVPVGATLTPREVIIAVFGGNALALNAHGGELIQWMQNPGGPTPGEASASAV